MELGLLAGFAGGSPITMLIPAQGHPLDVGVRVLTGPP